MTLHSVIFQIMDIAVDGQSGCVQSTLRHFTCSAAPPPPPVFDERYGSILSISSEDIVLAPYFY